MVLRSPVSMRLGAALKEPRESKARAAAIKEICSALRKAHGVLTDAAGKMDISLRSLQHWIGTYSDLDDEIRKIREEHGLQHYFGDPARSKAGPKSPRRKRAARAEG